MMPLAKRTVILLVVARMALLLIGMLAIVQPAPAQIYASSSCATGEAVTDVPNNPGLVSDCETLLSARDTLQGDTSTRMIGDILPMGPVLLTGLRASQWRSGRA